MSRIVRVAMMQAAPSPEGAGLDALEASTRNAADQGADIVVFPELHLFGADDDDLNAQNDALRESATSVDEVAPALGEIAVRAGVWLLPGSIVERRPDDFENPYNTALLFSPDGNLHATYRKVFPWRPTEPYSPGDRFVVVDLEGLGRFGLSICFDAWFPEVTRHLAWMGAEAVLNIVKTTTPDREQELVIARANSIVNQNFTVSVNAAGPIGMGRSIAVGPEGEVLEEMGSDPDVRIVELDLDRVADVQREGTAGSVVPWQQFRSNDATLRLPLYDGELVPGRWEPSPRNGA